eukprot:TRINITY_DN3077_c1_g2_i1.p1 TRINITY_DN3077_c1_g2~~TRINITY_DN3077_c1_g2_i1.p1  ORF type:complete len:110 (-),score=52.52 TRINITY_DN3077_c1_g2_i1:62-391(-)
MLTTDNTDNNNDDDDDDNNNNKEESITEVISTNVFKEKKYEFAAAAFVLPNTPINDSLPLTKFLTPIDVLERMSGFQFLPYVLTNDIKPVALCSKTECILPPTDFWKNR